ncbi:TPA: restriction endonuclease subunit S [Escherichia coli]|nr:restriction endonuclease subunit S [Escherichia coli]HAW1072503.1 restriction endonuclease subunit S [Escherichia coli]HAW7838056.1 restriction endonuclease subunit S [Escherichia coli]
MMKISEMPKYQTYKDSTEGWIGDVPEHWDIRKLKHLFYEKKHRPNMSLNCGAISFGKVVTKDDEKILLSTKASYQEVLSGEFLINPLNLNYDLISLRIALSEIDVVVSAGYIVIREKEELQKQYFKYLLHRYDVAYMKLLGSGVRQTISFNHIANSLLVFPPLEEQSLIAAFLDKKTALIDEAISIKEKQINLLKERKQIIIQQAVTQGLDPNVPMKDSGVDWIGDIPEHWEVVPLKRLAVLSPSVKVSNRKSKELVTFLAMEKVSTDGFIDQDTLMPICDVSQGFTVFNRGDVIVAKITPCFENGKSAWLNNLQTEFGYGSTEFHVLRCGQRIIGSFLYLIVSSPLFLNAGEAMMTGSAGQKRVPSSFIQNFPTAIPGVAEQEKIVSKVKELFSQIDVAVASKVNQIEKLKEYKTTLINSAVTGKIKITPEMVEQ